MNINIPYTIAAIAITALCTMLTRWAPFLLFGGKRSVPPSISYLGRVLPAAIMATLVVYCLKDVQLGARFQDGPAALISALLVALLHAWRRNTLLSIFTGTAVYMILIRLF